MAAANKFNPFVNNLANGVFNFGSDTFKVMLTLTAPTSSNSQKSDLTEIGTGFGYSAGGSVAATSSSGQTAGTYKLVLADVTFTASGGSIGPFRYAVLFDDTSASKYLILYWDYGVSITINTGESFTVDFDATTGVLTIA